MDGPIKHEEHPHLGFPISVSKAKVTQSRPVATDLDRNISQPGVARANRAVSRERVNGSEDYSDKFQQYVSSGPGNQNTI